MSEIRTTTITLDEYDSLKRNLEAKDQMIGALEERVDHLNDKVTEVEEKQPEVKIVHYKEVWNNWRDEMLPEEAKVEFTNLSEIETLAYNKAKVDYEQKLKELINNNKSLKDETERLDDIVASKNKQISTNFKIYNDTISDLRVEYKDNISKLDKAYKADVNSYKETIKELKEEIQKVKDGKTDKEIEEKRNKEILDLKNRIKDLEKILEDLKSMNFFKRVFKLRTISAEKLAAQKELIEREKRANKVGTTWVKEGGKYRVYNMYNEMKDYFSNTINSFHVRW
jgi:DNA repair exonuclease SbcCD ATPase subunit